MLIRSGSWVRMILLIRSVCGRPVDFVNSFVLRAGMAVNDALSPFLPFLRGQAILLIRSCSGRAGAPCGSWAVSRLRLLSPLCWPGCAIVNYFVALPAAECYFVRARALRYC